MKVNGPHPSPHDFSRSPPSRGCGQNRKDGPKQTSILLLPHGPGENLQFLPTFPIPLFGIFSGFLLYYVPLGRGIKVSFSTEYLTLGDVPHGVAYLGPAYGLQVWLHAPQHHGRSWSLTNNNNLPMFRPTKGGSYQHLHTETHKICRPVYGLG